MLLLKKTFIAFVLIYFGTLISLYALQRKILYFPNGPYVSPKEANVQGTYQEIAAKTLDNLDLKAWYAPATSKPLTLIFFHGNRDRLETLSDVGAPYLVAGYGFMLAEYRGYSGLPGKPTEDGLYADARAYITKLISMGIPENNIVLMGYSLGTGVATQMATEFKVRGLILMAPYTSIPAAAQAHYPMFPVKHLVKDHYANDQKIPNLHLPLLIANGGRDAVVPPSEGRELFTLANEPKQFYFAPGATHVDLFETDFYTVSLDWLKTLN